MAAPAHTRNNIHAGAPGFGPSSLFEEHLDQVEVVPRLNFAGTPVSLDRPRDYWVTGDGRGLAEFANQNFVSEGTNFSGREDGAIGGGYRSPVLRLGADEEGRPFETTLDIQTQLDRGLRDLKGELIEGSITFFANNFKDPITGQALRNERMTTRSLFDRELEHEGAAPLFALNRYNVEAQAGFLVPRAVGYSAGLLNHFFRGTFEGDVVPDPLDPNVVRFSGTNASPDALGGGTLELYGENADGIRTSLTALDPTVTVSAESGAALESARFVTSQDAERYVAVYKGQLGHERPGADPQRDPGAVVGTVQGGLRVEEIFSDGLRWLVRTPKGLFRLPLSAEEYWDVRWGDAPDVIVAQKGWGSDPDQPWEVAALRLTRRPGSPDFETIATPAGPEIIASAIGRTGFPLGMAVGTTVELNHTITYRQQLGRYRHHTVWAWQEWLDVGSPPGAKPEMQYRQRTLSVSPVEFETVTSQVFPFTVAFPMVLDAAHNPEFATDPMLELTPYAWDIQNVTVYDQERLVAEVRVTVTQPGPTAPHVRVPHYELNRTTGALEVFTENVLSPVFPHHGIFVWLLVDLARGEVLASTAGPRITVNAASTREAFVPFTLHTILGSPHVWRHGTEEYQGGPRDGEQLDHGWSPMALAKRTTQPVSQFTDLQLAADFTARIDRLGSGVTAFTMEGWARDELKAALASVGQFDAQVSTTQTTDEYAFAAEICLPCPGVRINTERRTVTGTSLDEAQRGRGLSAGNRWTLVASRRRAGTDDPTETLLLWDAPRGAVLANPTAGFYTIHDVTGSSALVTLRSRPSFTISSLLLPLVDTQSTQVFPGEDLGRSFRLLEPAHLYHVQDLRFYRTRPALGPTALPAKLVEAPDNPVGDYHVIPLP